MRLKISVIVGTILAHYLFLIPASFAEKPEIRLPFSAGETWSITDKD